MEGSKPKKIFITGIAGFIGFHLAKALHKEGYLIAGCDNFNSYYDPHLKQARAKLLQKEGILIHSLDLMQKEPFQKILDHFSPTHLFHMAAQAGVRFSLKEPHTYVDANISSFLNILESLKVHPQVKLIFASSSSVYGSNKKIPFSEQDSCDSPTNFYGASKKAGELMAYAYHHLYKNPMIGLRFFTVYGPYGRPDMAYFSFTKQIVEDIPLKVFNNGKLSRDFTYIEDIIQGCLATLDYPASFEIFNLGNSKPEEVLYLIQLIEEGFGKKAHLQFLPMQEGEIETTFADIDKSKRLLHFEPKTSLKEGMQKFIDWYQEYYSSC